MLNVNDDKHLYLPLFYVKPNGMKLRFKIEECKMKNDTYRFPFHGTVDELQRFESIAERLADDPVIKEEDMKFTWQMYHQLESDKRLLSNFEFVSLFGNSIVNITYQPDSEVNPETLCYRTRWIKPGCFEYRAPYLTIEERFLAAYNVTKNIPKAIDIALTTSGCIGYKGNYAVIDLKKWIKDKELVYKLS